MSKFNLSELATKINAAIDEGHKAASAEPDDGGSANLDHVVLHGLKGMREATMRNAGINCTKRRSSGEFSLTAPFAGQGARRHAGVQAMANSLKLAGVDCYVNYIMD